MNAGLGSRHKIIVNRSISLWHSTFGQTEDQLGYPAQLQETLFRLASFTEITLPGLAATEKGSEGAPHTFTFANTPSSFEELEDQPRGADLNSTMPPGRSEPGHGMSKLSASSNVQDATPRTSSKKTAAPAQQKALSSPAPRLRHDDSQVQFTAIERSPSSLPTADSQLLTARQKDVRARQQNEAAAAPLNLRSSPNPQITGKNHTSDLVVAVSSKENGHGNFIDSFSPALPHPSSMVSFLGSSPTLNHPKSGRKTPSQALHPPANPAQQENDEDSVDEIPSSPPIPLPRKRCLSNRSGVERTRFVTKSSPAKPIPRKDLPDLSEGRPSSFPCEKPMSKRAHVKDDENCDKGKNDSTSPVDPSENAITEQLEPSPRRTYEAVKESLHQRKRMRTPSRRQKEAQKDDESEPLPKRVSIGSSRCDSISKATTSLPEPTTQPEIMAQRDELPPDEEDLVSSQLEMEIARAASFTTKTPEPTNEETDLVAENANAGQKAQEEEDNSQARKQHKKRGRKSKKTRSTEASQVSEPAEDEVLDCIVVSSSPRAASQSPIPVTVTEPDARAKSGRKRTANLTSEPADAVQEEPQGRKQVAANSRKRKFTDAALEATNDGQDELLQSSQATTRSQRRASKEAAPEQEANVEGAATLPSKRKRLSRHNSRVGTPPSSDAIAPPEGNVAIPKQPGQVTEQALPPLRDDDGAPSSDGPTTSQTNRMMEEALTVPMEEQDADLVPDMERLLERAKKGVRPDDKVAFMKASMELMKIAMTECQGLVG